MTSPFHLYATAAAWSLHLARIILAVNVDREAADNGAQLLDAAPILRSSSAYGIRHGIGGHGDPTGAVLLARPIREDYWARKQAKADERLNWIAGQFAPGPGLPLGRILDRIPDLMPGTARLLAQHLDDEDQLLRGEDWLDEPRPRRLLTGPVPPSCPACRARATLHVQTAGPESAWTVVCDGTREPGGGPHNPCLCTGAGCGCGMEGAVEGAPHIWPRAAVLGAVAGGSR